MIDQKPTGTAASKSVSQDQVGLTFSEVDTFWPKPFSYRPNSSKAMKDADERVEKVFNQFHQGIRY